MKIHPSQETAQEALLRTTLHEHEPEIVDTERAWAMISSRIATPSASKPMMVAHLFRNQRPKHTWKRMAGITVAAALLVLVLSGALLFAPLNSWLNPQQTAFAMVNQVKQTNGITLTVGQAYADTGHTYVTYSLQISVDWLRQGYVLSAPTKDTLVANHQEVKRPKPQQVACKRPNRYDQPEQCLINYLAVQPTPTGNSVTFTWDVPTVTLIRRSTLAPDAQHPRTITVSGHWHFVFTVPFYHENRNPAIPPIFAPSK
ncbi:MAG TPA: DUF4179 domain-containing protein [Ktedonobacteraceae bacterium]|nr:DUF4179 domain-containing protein [Ktedonobacteraceae bacterium]